MQQLPIVKLPSSLRGIKIKIKNSVNSVAAKETVVPEPDCTEDCGILQKFFCAGAIHLKVF